MPIIDVRGQGSRGPAKSTFDSKVEAAFQGLGDAKIFQARQATADFIKKQADMQAKLERTNAMAEHKLRMTNEKADRDVKKRSFKALDSYEKETAKKEREDFLMKRTQERERTRADRQQQKEAVAATRTAERQRSAAARTAERQRISAERAARAATRSSNMALFAGYEAATIANRLPLSAREQARQDNKQYNKENGNFFKRVAYNTPDAIKDAAGIVGKVIGVLAATAIEGPLLPGQALRGVSNLAQPMIDLQKGAYAAGGAGKFSGQDLVRKLYTGGTTGGLNWMSSLMLTPDKVLDMMDNLGIAQGSADKYTATAQMLGLHRLMPGFRGMQEGTTEGVTRQFLGYNSASTAGTNNYLTSIGAIMEDAVAKGMDRAKVLGNIQSATDMVAKNSGGISSRGILDMFSRMGAAGTPGGRTGESAMNMLSSMGGIANNPGSNPAAMFMMYSQMTKFNNLSSSKDVENFVGSDAFNAASPAVRKRLLEDITSANAAGNPLAAFMTAVRGFLPSNPGRIGELIQPGISGLPQYIQDHAMSGLLGSSLSDAISYRVGAGKKAPTAPASLSMGYNSNMEDYYRQVLGGSMGPDQVEAFLAEGRKRGQSPIAALAASQLGDAGMPTDKNSLQTQMSTLVARNGTPPGVGQLENQTAQATLAGADTALAHFAPLVESAADAMEKFYTKLQQLNAFDWNNTGRGNPVGGAGLQAVPYGTPTAPRVMNFP